MTYTTIDTSPAEARPCFLYQFVEEDQVWRFTSRASAWSSAGSAGDEAQRPPQTQHRQSEPNPPPPGAAGASLIIPAPQVALMPDPIRTVRHIRDVPDTLWCWPNLSPAKIACRGTGAAGVATIGPGRGR
jgi:hypothetical protein